MSTYLTHALVTLDQAVYGFDGQEAVVHGHMIFAAVQDVWSDDGSQVVNVHLAAALFVHVAETGDPVQERKEDLHGISVCLGKQAASQVQHSPSSFALLNLLRCYPEIVELVGE